MTNLIRRGSEWLTYPFTVVTALVLYTTILASGIATFLSAYVPVLAAAGFITLLEIRRPYHRAWRPAAGTIKDDLLFMVLVQILVPRALALLIVLSLAAPQETLLVGGSFGWPHELSVAMQVVLMVLIADFFRYWLHRAAHHIPWLWRLHAVHHSPPGLYWLNTGRFHPFEKTLQFMADSVPFALLGVDERVLAAYFVFYAINGFFQHSNIKLRFGLLNYIISSAELHRWHHSRVSAESNRNFGNNIILWDLLFGTWYLPRRRRVPEVGLVNRKYPQGFLVQMLTPFTPQIAEREVPLMSLTQLVRGLALRAISVVIHWRYWRPFWHAAKTPRRTQDQVLADIVTTNANTKFGREHGFHEIRTYHDFKHRVPIQTYDSLRPYITRQMQTKHPDLTAAQPVMYGRTSGTTGNAKLIPVLNSTLTQYREQQNLFMYSQYRACPEAFLGQGLAIVSPAIEDRLDTGQPCGSVSGHIYKSMPRFIRANYVVPSEVFEISDYDRKYRVILRFALAERDITYLGGANPTSFLRLLEILNQCKHELVESLETGTFQALDGLPEGIRAPLAKRIVPDRARAARLKPLLYQTEITFADVWPGIRLLATWTAGSCGIALETLRHKLPEQTQIRDLGFVSTEFRGTFAIDGHSGAGVPLLNQHFYEFCERENWDAGVAETVTAEKIEPGRDYYL
ncbi:MAG: GH3 auxin-responsive promoter family protein, partial [Gammaproteobacteria bacterium]|nr:GH3 auxin-responsive promoter family protein [Gammaproteobacteria bacterium]